MYFGLHSNQKQDNPDKKPAQRQKADKITRSVRAQKEKSLFRPHTS